MIKIDFTEKEIQQIRNNVIYERGYDYFSKKKVLKIV